MKYGSARSLMLVFCVCLAQSVGTHFLRKASKSWMTGHPKNTKGYKLWDFNLQKVVISRDVLIEEVRQSNEICEQESKSENENIRKTPSSENVDHDGDDDERADQD
jgi:hypothetical protein